MSDSKPTVLLADDQADVREALRLLLKSEGIASVGVADPAAALEAVRKREFACALIDCNYSRDTTSGEEGLDLLERLRQLAPELPVVAMTAWGNVPLTVEAMRRGAADFIEKPWNNARLLSVLRAQIALGEGVRKQRRLEAENALLRGGSGDAFIAESPVMRRVLAMVDRIASSDANVLVLGENGTGKGVIAERIHALSPRAARSLVKVNMGGIAESVFESEMFGHVRGAYTDAKGERIGRFELADGGTLFLDEIGNVPAAQQPKLLRVLEDGEFERLGSSRTQRVDVRLVSATNADLAAEVAEGRFRRDLMYRLNTLEVRLPPLRERVEDILPLARAFLARSAARYGRDGLQLAASAERALMAWRWPGNVRELQHLMERAALLAEHDQVSAGALSFGAPPEPAQDIDGMTLEQAEAWLVKHALERHDGNLQHAADALGITRQSLYRRLEKHDLRDADNDDATD
ncbi:sigma-54-dependent transcriptional regulator [Rhodanobacter glycinis]|uniref:DNA-binding transcriptional response regulator, NtrC family, contains REC, AAA-type ATPase, and a Fis-type DNA-binding domains n=1 Tax=Rhodanobacter glycinis TaxID=582702 RepID=A0A1I4DXV3_9GAMM|nr:sigma-54 dependent transcriptional regulator [Rhodanobacter glycinis]SFK96936.1 DNA-binding transcriptional response regulator, NtrC family, contains REC, AAA-type ATPase, and a Fis-type DNA-binding domains [Rhodanobacter glycinis]